MRSIEFKYALHRRRDIPLIPVGLRTGGKWMEVWAYVDSGSFYSIFDEKVAEILDIDLETDSSFGEEPQSSSTPRPWPGSEKDSANPLWRWNDGWLSIIGYLYNKPLLWLSLFWISHFGGLGPYFSV